MHGIVNTIAPKGMGIAAGTARSIGREIRPGQGCPVGLDLLGGGLLPRLTRP